jgi:hypothetical protein
MENPLFDNIKVAIREIASKMAPLIVRYAECEKISLKEIHIRLMDINSLEQVHGFLDLLENRIKGVNAIKRFEIKDKMVTILIQFQGDEMDFLRKIKEPELLPSAPYAMIDDKGWVVVRFPRDLQ